MRGLLQANGRAEADAYLAWWALAGLDGAVSEAPVNWLRPAPAPAPSRTAAAAEPAVLQAKPADLPAFHRWLAEDSGQPERRWPGAAILPQGVINAPVMVITDMPDPADMAAGSLLTERAGALFDAMLRSMGLARNDIYIASMFLSRPPGGMVEASDLSIVADRMRSHIALAAPRRLLLLGDRTARIMLSDEDGSRIQGLRNISHEGGTLPAFATFHPRLLLSQPAAKAECWRTLQSLIKEMSK